LYFVPRRSTSDFIKSLSSSIDCDPKHVDIPVQRLIAKAYANERRRLIDRERAQDISEVPAGIAYTIRTSAARLTVTRVTSAPRTRTGW
jgi:gamma-glutamyltranspeptidase